MDSSVAVSLRAGGGAAVEVTDGVEMEVDESGDASLHAIRKVKIPSKGLALKRRFMFTHFSP